MERVIEHWRSRTGRRSPSTETKGQSFLRRPGSIKGCRAKDDEWYLIWSTYYEAPHYAVFSSVTSSLLVPSILLFSPLSDTLSLFSPECERPSSTLLQSNRKYYVCIIIIVSFDRKQEDKGTWPIQKQALPAFNLLFISSNKQS